MISVIPGDADVLTSHLVPAERGRLSCASNAVGVWPALCAEPLWYTCVACALLGSLYVYLALCFLLAGFGPQLC